MEAKTKNEENNEEKFKAPQQSAKHTDRWISYNIKILVCVRVCERLCKKKIK